MFAGANVDSMQTVYSTQVQVQSERWHFFHVDVGEFTESLTISFSGVSSNSDPDLYVAHNKFPSLSSYDWAVAECEPCHKTTSLVIGRKTWMCGCCGVLTVVMQGTPPSGRRLAVTSSAFMSTAAYRLRSRFQWIRSTSQVLQHPHMPQRLYRPHSQRTNRLRLQRLSLRIAHLRHRRPLPRVDQRICITHLALRLLGPPASHLQRPHLTTTPASNPPSGPRTRQHPRPVPGQQRHRHKAPARPPFPSQSQLLRHRRRWDQG